MRDDDRYVEYLQEQLLSDDGWQPVLARLRDEPAPSLPNHQCDAEWEDVLRRWNSFEPSTRYDLPATHAVRTDSIGEPG